MRPVALIGFMASGKSTIGKGLAGALGLPFIDTDEEVLHSQEATPGQIIREHGEAFFRRCEQQALSAAAQRESPFVCATGGGIVTYEPSRRILRQHFHVVLLRIHPETALLRIQNDEADRPLSQASNPMQHIRDLLRYRSPLYEETADFTIDTDNALPSEIILQIQDYLRASS